MATEPSPLLSTSKKPIIPESNIPRRRLIILSYWIIALLGVPYWWKSTTIERLDLPVDRIRHWINKTPCYLTPTVELAIRVNSGVEVLPQAVISHLEMKLPTSQCVNLRIGTSASTSESSYDLTIGGEESSISSGRSAVAASSSSSNYFKTLESARLIASTLLDLTTTELDPKVVTFSSNYKLVFSLLNQDSASGDAILEWDIENLLRQYIQPLLTSLAPLHNFTVETQIQYFAPLTINIEASSEEGGGSTIDEEDLKAFVNPADWKMPSSANLDPIIQFILYVPSQSNRPLRIKQTSTGLISPSNAFITPQWGGIAIFNPPSSSSSNESDLSIPFRHFLQQLHLLLGVPTSITSSKEGDKLDQWQVDGMIRKRLEDALKESVDTLRAIRKLVDDSPNMRVGEEVIGDVTKALDELDLAEKFLSISISNSLLHSATALKLSTKAYFNPTMLSLLYFPDEHKYAVYTPFFGPISVPLLAALFKEWKAFKEARKRRKMKEEEEKEKKE